MIRVVTFEENGVSKISDYSNSIYSNDDIIKLLHKSSARKQYAQYLRSSVKDLNKISDISLGYLLQEMPKFYSNISNIKFHNHRNFNGLK